MRQTADPHPEPSRQLEHRYEGIAKVSGRAKYAADFTQPFDRHELLYAYIVQSTIPSGTIVSIDRSVADSSPGVVAILTPFNAPKLKKVAPQPPARRALSLLQDVDIHYNGQPLALVVAKTLESAEAAASMLKIRYAPKSAHTTLMDRLTTAHLPKNPGKEPAEEHRGDLRASFAKAAVVIENTYVTPIQHHNPMEPHATIAWWEGEKLTVFDATQYISGVHMSLAQTLDIPIDYVRVINPVVGGGFGSKGSMWSHVPLCAMAAKVTGKPVKLVLGRQQMFGPVGGRPSTINKIKLGATADGKLVAMQHDVVMNASVMEEFVEHAEGPAKNLYRSEANSVSTKLVEMNLGVSTFMRAPGEAPGTAVLEVAMDELAEKLKMDPVQLRLANYAEIDPSHNRPWTGKHLRECYSHAAESFGWSKRAATPRTVSEGNLLIGHGMATATYPANRSAAHAVVRMLPGGKMFVASGTQDLGTGTYTIMAQQAAADMGIDPTLVEVRIGDSTLPQAPVSGGSQSSASVLPAIREATTQLKLKLADLAIEDSNSALHGLRTVDIDIQNGKLLNKNNHSQSDSLIELIARNGNKPVEATGTAEPVQDKDAMTATSWGAIFAEVAVDRHTHMVKVRRVVGTYDIGRLLNRKTGLNQLMGGIVWGVSFALYEQANVDPVYGRVVNSSLAEYHIPVNADIGTLDVTVLDIPDFKFNPIGSRGIGEIGITGAAAAVANAIYNATGKRVREYPITPDKIMNA